MLRAWRKAPKLLLDAMVSSRGTAGPLREAGFDVRAATEEKSLGAMTDPRLFELAAEEDRVLITFNARHFLPLATQWAAGGRHHAGLLVLVGIDHGEFATILRRLTATLSEREEPAEWQDLTLVLGRW